MHFQYLHFVDTLHFTFSIQTMVYVKVKKKKYTYSWISSHVRKSSRLSLCYVKRPQLRPFISRCGVS